MNKKIEAIINNTFKENHNPGSGAIIWFNDDIEMESEFYCTDCLADRKMKVKNIRQREDLKINTYKNRNSAVEKNLPLIYDLQCLQCKSRACLVIQKTENEIKEIILYEKNGGCSSKNAPKGVKYYLNEAYLSKQIGAKSSSMAMYRAALDFILYDQGYTNGMLGKKIEKLEKDIEEKNAPKWAMDIDIEFLQVIKNIGNSSIHTNDGNIDKQENIDETLLNIVDVVFSELLDKIYEQPIRSKTNLEILKAKMNCFKNEE